MSVSYDSIKKAGEEARQAAIDRGHVTKSGIPYTKVCTDGSWGKRSYGTTYNSLSGAAVIIDCYTGKVLFYDVRNKYCLTCSKAKNKEKCPKHICYKNWISTKPSTETESDIILEGFKRSNEMHGLIYSQIVCDADSNVYKRIVDNNVYREENIIPERILCTNHLLRNLCRKLNAVSKITQGRAPRIKEFVSTRNIVKTNVSYIRQSVEDAVERWRTTENITWKNKIKELRQDILNIPDHVFGEHKNCKEKKYDFTLKNNVSALKKFGFYQKVEDAIIFLSNHSESLLHKVTNNKAEEFNSIACHLLNGKRINYSFTNQ